MSMSKLRFEIADQDYDCNACTFLQAYLEDNPELTDEEKEAVALAEKNGWKVLQGERCRRYSWNEGSEEEIDCVEIPAIAQICSDHDLWPQD